MSRRASQLSVRSALSEAAQSAVEADSDDWAMDSDGDFDFPFDDDDMDEPGSVAPQTMILPENQMLLDELHATRLQELQTGAEPAPVADPPLRVQTPIVEQPAPQEDVVQSNLPPLPYPAITEIVAQLAQGGRSHDDYKPLAALAQVDSNFQAAVRSNPDALRMRLAGQSAKRQLDAFDTATGENKIEITNTIQTKYMYVRPDLLKKHVTNAIMLAHSTGGRTITALTDNLQIFPLKMRDSILNAAEGNPSYPGFERLMMKIDELPADRQHHYLSQFTRMFGTPGQVLLIPHLFGTALVHHARLPPDVVQALVANIAELPEPDRAKARAGYLYAEMVSGSAESAATSFQDTFGQRPSKQDAKWCLRRACMYGQPEVLAKVAICANGLGLSEADKMDLLLAKEASGGPNSTQIAAIQYAFAFGKADALTAYADAIDTLRMTHKADVLLGVTDKFGITGLQTAAQWGQTSVIAPFVSTLQKLRLTDKVESMLMAGSLPPLFDAVSRNQPEFVSVFLQEIQRLPLDQPTMMRLTSATSSAGFSALYQALECGNVESIHAYVNELRHMDLDTDSKIKLYTSTSKNGFTALCAPAIFGKPESITAYLDGMAQLGLRSDQIVGILNTLSKEGAAPLYYAMFNNRPGVVSAFVAGLKKLGLDKPSLESIMISADDEGMSGRSVAVSEGHLAAVAAFDAGWIALGLDPDRRP